MTQDVSWKHITITHVVPCLSIQQIRQTQALHIYPSPWPLTSGRTLYWEQNVFKDHYLLHRGNWYVQRLSTREHFCLSISENARRDNHYSFPAGYIGGSVLQAIVAHPKADTFDIIALVRNEAKAKAIEKVLGIKTIIGSLEDDALLTEYSAKADVVYQNVSFPL